MTATHVDCLEFSPEVITWAKSWVTRDRDYLNQRAKFAPEPIKSIARLALNAAGISKEKEENPRIAIG
ncbi:MAG TPA: hypothetical protein VF354_03895 [Candidatus Methanoperedens sp.]